MKFLVLVFLIVLGTTVAYAQCPASPPTRLAIGEMGRVTPGASNNIRPAPGDSSQKLGEIPPGGEFLILDGPECDSSPGRAWWRVDYEGIVGWTAEGDGSNYWLEPVPDDSPQDGDTTLISDAPPDELAGISFSFLANCTNCFVCLFHNSPVPEFHDDRNFDYRGDVTEVQWKEHVCVNQSSLSNATAIAPDGTRYDVTIEGDGAVSISLPDVAYLVPGRWLLEIITPQRAYQFAVIVPELTSATEPTSVYGEFAPYTPTDLVLSGFRPNERILIISADPAFQNYSELQTQADAQGVALAELDEFGVNPVDIDLIIGDQGSILADGSPIVALSDGTALIGEDSFDYLRRIYADHFVNRPQASLPGGCFVIEDFTGGVTATSWFEGRTDAQQVQITDGSYDVTLFNVPVEQEAPVSWGTLQDLRFRDTIIEAEISASQFSDNSRTGIWTRYQDGNNFLAFMISSTGEYRIARYRGQYADLVGWTFTPALNTGNFAINTLRIIDHDGRFDFFINDQYITSVQDDTWQDGRIGFFGSSANRPVTYSLESIRICEP